MKLILILPDIRSVHNVGSIFRTSDAVGVNKIFLTGYTPAPLDRFNRPRNDFTKVALGAEKTIEWEHLGLGGDLENKKSLKRLLSDFKKQKSIILAIEQDNESVDYLEIPKLINRSVENGIENIVVVFGNEVDGLPKDIIKECDYCVELPMNGKKESLNVSITAGIILYKIKEAFRDLL